MSDAEPILNIVSLGLVFVIAVAGSVLMFVLIRGGKRRAGQMLTEWAARNGYRIIESRRLYIFRGPYFSMSSRAQIIYRVTVQDAQGNIRRGWVRCGSYFLGPWRDVVAVRWEDE
jgi:hypothetical protein